MSYAAVLYYITLCHSEQYNKLNCRFIHRPKNINKLNRTKNNLNHFINCTDYLIKEVRAMTNKKFKNINIRSWILIQFWALAGVCSGNIMHANSIPGIIIFPRPQERICEEESQDYSCTGAGCCGQIAQQLSSGACNGGAWVENILINPDGSKICTIGCNKCIWLVATDLPTTPVIG